MIDMIRAALFATRTRRLFATGLMAFTVVLAMTGCGGGTSASVGLIDWPDSVAEVGPAIGMRAPNFSLPTADGETLTLAEQTGAPLVLNFFASWCTSCREEMALFEQASRDGSTILGVNLREKPEVVQALATETGATFPLALDRSGEVTRAYRVTNLPATFLLDEEARVITIVRGPLDEEGLTTLLAMAYDAPGDA
jgi:peroxiredoxin